MQQKVFRSNTNKIIAGVCGGLAAYFKIDPILIRIAFVIFGIWGFGFLAYLLIWILIPESPII